MDKSGEIETSRRIFLSRSVLMAAGTVAATVASAAFTRESPMQPAANLSGEKITQINLVVRDVEKAAKVFWKFLAFPRDATI